MVLVMTLLPDTYKGNGYRSAGCKEYLEAID